MSINGESTEHQRSINWASTEHQLSINWASTEHQLSINGASTEHQRSINGASTEHQRSINGASTEHQRSVNNLWSSILDNPMAMECRQPTTNLSAAYIGKTASDNIIYAPYNSAPTDRQHFLWRLRMLHSNELHCTVPNWSFTQSVFSICPCLQLYKYACNVSQIWFFCFWL